MSDGVREEAPLILATAANDAFAIGVAVMLYSALVNLEKGRSVRAYILSDGISPGSKRRIEAAVARTRRDAVLEWIEADLGELATLALSDWFKSTSYLRLRLPELLPQDVERLIYLDSDMVVEGDLVELWRAPFDGHLALAVQNFDPPQLGGVLPVPARELSLAAELPYYNSGLMVMNLPRWRDERLLERVTELSRRFAPHIVTADQDGINLAIGGDWGALDPLWNVQLLTVNAYGFASGAPENELKEARERLKTEARIFHYTGAKKPWHHMYRRPAGERFLHYLGRTGWLGTAEFAHYSFTRRAMWQAIRTGRDLRNAARRITATFG